MLSEIRKFIVGMAAVLVGGIVAGLGIVHYSVDSTL